MCKRPNCSIIYKYFGLYHNFFFSCGKYISDSFCFYCTDFFFFGSHFILFHFLRFLLRRMFGCKWTMALSFIAYMPFILSNLYPRLYTMIPSGLAVGFGGGPLWCAKCTYLTVISEALAIFNGKDSKSDTLIVRCFGLFFIFYQLAQVWGNLISSSGWPNLSFHT